MNVENLEKFFQNYENCVKVAEKGYEHKIESFFNKFSYRYDVYLEIKKEMDKKLSSEFNMFDYIDTKEVGLSRLISMMFDCDGNHGQGRLFLKLFLETLKDFHIENDNFKVFTEYAVEKRRIDILLLNKTTNTAIIIENKPYAYDQENQVSDYYKNLGYENKFVIYLTRNDTEPTNFNDKGQGTFSDIKAKDRFKILTFKEFSDNFLKLCYEKCESEKFRFFIEDFRDYIQTNLMPNQGEENEK